MRSQLRMGISRAMLRVQRSFLRFQPQPPSFQERVSREPNEVYGVAVADGLELFGSIGAESLSSLTLTEGEGVQVLGRSYDSSWLYVAVTRFVVPFWVYVAADEPTIRIDPKLLAQVPVMALPGLWVIDISAPDRAPRPIDPLDRLRSPPQWLPANDVTEEWDGGEYESFLVEESYPYRLYSETRIFSPDMTMLLTVIEGERRIGGTLYHTVGIVNQAGEVLAKADVRPPRFFHGPVVRGSVGRWSPDGSSALIVDSRPWDPGDAEPRIVVLSPSTPSRTVATGWYPFWSSEGEIIYRISFRYEWLDAEARRVSVDGEPLQLGVLPSRLDGPVVFLRSMAPAFLIGEDAGVQQTLELRWSLDGTRVAIGIRRREPYLPDGCCDGGRFIFQDWYVADADGTNLNFVARTYQIARVVWSPDGRFLAINSVSSIGFN